jgi:nucleoside-diphosphate-sugar epimerase
MCGEPYADSKVKAEKIITAQKNNGRIAITVVRPGFIYGPRERAWMPQLIDAVAQGRAVLVDGGNKETNVIYIENLNKAIEATLFNEKAYGQIYNLTDGQGITKKQLFDAISKELNLPKVQKKLPSWLVKPVFMTISSIASFLPVASRKKLSRFSMAAYRLIGLNQGFSIVKAETELGYTQRIPFATGISETLGYSKKQNSTAPAPALR